MGFVLIMYTEVGLFHLLLKKKPEDSNFRFV